MLKKLVVLATLLLFLLPAHATIFMHAPIEATLVDGNTTELGVIGRGQTFSIVIERKSEQQDTWNMLAVNTELLPEDWFASTELLDETLVVRITVPEHANTTTQRITLTAFNTNQPAFGETFFANVRVVNPESVFTLGIDLSTQETIVNKLTPFSLSFTNKSIAPASFVISSNFPRGWVQEQQLISVSPQSTIDFELNIVPLVYGKKTGTLFVHSTENEFSQSFDLILEVFPTLKGKFQAGLLGVPFFSLALWPGYLLNGFLSLWM
jgi:hypothetical protein